MNTCFQKIAPALGALVLALLTAPASRAACGGIDPLKFPHAALQPQAAAAAPQLSRYGFPGDGDRSFDNDAAIVGFWHVKFTSEGSTGIPDGTPIDAGYSQWHSDGTEIMNSGGRAASTTNFCLGVWKDTGYHTFKLNHFASSWDPTPTSTSPTGTLVGPAQIQEQITLSHDGDQFSGTFTIDQYDENLNLLAHVQGTISGTRIDADTAVSSIF